MNRSTSRSPIFCVVILAAVAWGVLAFGAVYEWAYYPLLAVSAALGIWGLVRPRLDPPAIGSITSALLFVTGAVLVQLVPLPTLVRQAISPAVDPFLREYEPWFAVVDVTPIHALSIRPSATWLALTCLAAFGLLLMGISRRLGRRDVRRLAFGITILGALVALEGMIQKPLSPERIYGFWEPEMGGSVVFGPFVNRNHFSGWMLMALPLAIGYLADATVRAVGPGARQREAAAWLSTPSGSGTLVLAFGAFMMALSIVLTLSRSGLVAMGTALLGAAFLVQPAGTSRRLRLAATVMLMVFIGGAVAWVGLDRVGERFVENGGGALEGRQGAWADAVSIARDFPLTGTGLNTFSVAMLRYQKHNPHKTYGEAHNDYLQLAAEGGVLLALPVVALLIAVVRAIRRAFLMNDRSTYWIRVGAVTGMGAIALQELVDFSLQLPGNAVLLCVLVAIALHRARPLPAPAPRTPAQVIPLRGPRALELEDSTS